MKSYEDAEFNGCVFIQELPSVSSANGNKRRVAKWRCECGNEFTATIGNVSSGQVRSCGCKKTAAIVRRCTKHGHSTERAATRLYRFWQSMQDRCINSKSTAFKDYGQRGIKVHPSWVGSFETFREYFNRTFGLDEIPDGLTMDRRDNGGNYAPGNLRFATRKTQANNKRSSSVVSYNGRRMTVAELAALAGVKYSTLWARLNKQHQTPEQAIR